MFKNFWNSLKIISASSLLLSGSFFVQHDVAMADRFAETCVNRMLGRRRNDNRVYLVAECRNREGTYLGTSLPISEYIANSGGNLVWQAQGSFQYSCSNLGIFIFNNTFNLSARCGDGRGGYNNSIINLNSKISNQNGVLQADF